MTKGASKYRMALTSKQKELIPHLAKDRTNEQIAQALDITIGAAKQRIEHLMNNVMCIDRDELVKYAKGYIAENRRDV